MSNKRKRNLTADDCDDCMPISKRINQLQIRPQDCNTGIPDENHDRQNGNNNNLAEAPCCSDDWNRRVNGLPANQGVPGHQPSQCGQSVPPHYNHPYCSNGGPEQGYEADMGDYEPELDATHNPHYYHVNSMLYHAHVARRRRHRTSENT